MGKRKSDRAALEQLIEVLEGPIGIFDTKDVLMLGKADAADSCIEVAFQGSKVGYVKGPESSVGLVKNMLELLLKKQAERKEIGNEVLQLYREVNLIYGFSEELAKIIEPEKIAQTALWQAQQLIKADAGWLLLLEENENELTSLASLGNEVDTEKMDDRDDHIIKRILKDGKADIINDTSEDIRTQKERLSLRSLMFAPLQIGERLTGLIIIGSLEKVDYVANDLKLLNTLALQTASAIESALLYEKNISEAREREASLKRIDRLKDQFLANTSHELRTPLNGIIGLSEALQEQVKDPEQKEDLDMIIVSSKRLRNLVNDILDFSKLKEQEIQLQTKPLDVRTVTDVVFRLIRPLIRGKELELEASFPEKMPLVKADEDRVQQILYNLVGNAIKFTAEGKVSVSAVQRHGML